MNTPSLGRETGGLRKKKTSGNERDVPLFDFRCKPRIEQDQQLEQFKKAFTALVKRAEETNRIMTGGDPIWCEYERRKRDFLRMNPNHVDYELGIDLICNKLNI